MALASFAIDCEDHYEVIAKSSNPGSVRDFVLFIGHGPETEDRTWGRKSFGGRGDVTSIKEAWEGAKERAGVKCRFHDLKHTAVSRMLDAGVPIAKIAEIVGWSPATMVRMSARYGHFGLEDLRDAVETISRPARGELDQRSPVNPPGLPASPNVKAS